MQSCPSMATIPNTKVLGRLQNVHYRCIADGSKTVEIRLNDSKRREIKAGDKVRLLPMGDAVTYLEVGIESIYSYPTFAAALESQGYYNALPLCSNLTEAINTYLAFDSYRTQEAENGVLAFVLGNAVEFGLD